MANRVTDKGEESSKDGGVITIQAPTRLHSIDYLRGLAAFGIMIYHYLSWNGVPRDAGTVLGRVGIYGVALFYVLSGLTLHHAYRGRFPPSTATILDFFKRRAFRILPLFWLATLTTIALSDDPVDLMKLFTNLTGLFGFVDWSSYYAIGAWSIGNELTFYVLLFPVLALSVRRRDTRSTPVWIAPLMVYLYYGFVEVDSTVPLAEQWSVYVNPLNQGFLFVLGFLISQHLGERPVRTEIAYGVTLFGVLAIATYPAHGDTVQLVTGTNRIAFTIFVSAICVGVYKSEGSIPYGSAAKALGHLGNASYSVYLIHPVVYSLVGAVGNRTGIPTGGTRIWLSVASTLAISHLVYRHFETFFINLGRTSARAVHGPGEAGT